MSTYSINISGPSASMAWLRALSIKMSATGQRGWTHARQVITGATQLGRTAATTVLTLVGTPANYDAVVAVTHAGITGGCRFALRTAAWATRQVSTGVLAVRDTIAKVSPPLAAALTRLVLAVTRPVRTCACTIQRGVEATGRPAWMLARTDLVRSVTTKAAQVATALIGLHALTEGAAAAHLVQALPWTVNLVSVATNPSRALMFVAGTALAAAGIALVQLLRQPAGEPRDPSPAAPEMAADRPAEAGENLEAEVLTDLAVIARTVNVEVQRDGSITVSGIPATVPADLGQVVAEIAIEAALRQFQRTLRLRPTPNRDDRRLFTKAARDAIRAEAHRRRDAA